MAAIFSVVSSAVRVDVVRPVERATLEFEGLIFIVDYTLGNWF